MDPPLKADFLNVAEYLTGEEQSEIRHEYVDGQVYAMAGGSEEHNIITLNIASILRARSRGSACRVFMADMKARVSVQNHDQFYYPDIIVTCDPRDTDRYFKRFPTVLIEVLSEATERTDRTEKFWSYPQLETLEEYILVAQDHAEVTMFRRGNKWAPETMLEGEVRIGSLQTALALREIYEGLKFVV